jgi:hypothetical protein
MAHYAQRFNGWTKEEAYEEIKGVLEKDAPSSLPVSLKDLTINLAEKSVIVAGKSMPLGTRAKTNLFRQIGLGKIDQIVSVPSLRLIQNDLDAYLKDSRKSIVLKVKGGNRVEGVVSNDYKEIPHTDVIGIVEDLDAHPVRIYQNDYVLRMQATFDERQFVPDDGEAIRMGVQVHSSEMGGTALKFDVFIYRVVCGSGCILNNKTIGSIRDIHVSSMKQAEVALSNEIERVMDHGQDRLLGLVNRLIALPFNSDTVIDFITRYRIGTKSLAIIGERFAGNKTMFDTWKVLTAAGHDPSFSDTIQDTFEKAAGDLLHEIEIDGL